MPAKLIDNSYGKWSVRVTKLTRLAKRHELKELSVNVLLRGEFDQTYLTGNNEKVIATDSMKNTVYVLAKQHPIESIESFAAALAEHFVQKYGQVETAQIMVRQKAWNRLGRDGRPHPHAFISGGEELRKCLITNTRGNVAYSAGVENMVVLKTTDSAFTGYVRDEYTTLPETTDRIFATSIKAIWEYESGRADANWNDLHQEARQAMLDVFAEHRSLSVQQTLYAIGEAVLARCPLIRRIKISMPNQHRIPFNLAPFGLPNDNDIFVPTNEPYGLISGTIERS